MPNELEEAFNKLSVSNPIPEAEDVLTYYKIHAELCRQYKKEIDYIYNLLKETREERIDFFEKRIHNICNKLEEENISPQAINEWIDQLEKDMERSFNTTEELLHNFIISKTAEFEIKLKEKLGLI